MPSGCNTRGYCDDQENGEPVSQEVDGRAWLIYLCKQKMGGIWWLSMNTSEEPNAREGE